MDKGKKYRVTYKLEWHRTAREMVMVYLGEDYTGENEEFSARPVAGTHRFPKGSIIKTQEVPMDTEIKLNGRSRS